jgi:hypothetical protein
MKTQIHFKMKTLKYIFLMFIVFGCLNKPNTKNPELLNPKESRKTHLDTVYISKDPLVDLYYLKDEYNEIIVERDEFFTDVFKDPDLTYESYLKANNDNRFSSQFGADAYYQCYAYFLKKKYNSGAYSNNRSKLVELYQSINKAYAIMARGGSGFAHNIPRIYAYVEWDIYNHYVLNDLDENSATNFLAEKELYLVSNNKILKLDKFRNNDTIKLLFDSIHQKIENQFELKYVMQFQDRFDHLISQQ